jgi:hypothetical protein
MRVGFRLIIFVLLALFIWLGPAYRQVLGLRGGVLHGWTMYSRVGTGMLHVEYRLRGPDGVERPLDRFAVLGQPTPKKARGAGRKIATLLEAQQLGRGLCVRLGPESDVRLYVRKAVQSGWRQLAAGEENLCSQG